jgi:membrane protein
MRTVMNAVYRINTRKLAIIKILEQILLVIILAILFFISNVFIWMFSFVRNFASTIPLLHAMPVEFFSTANSFLVSYVPGLVMFFLLNRFVPDKGITPRIALIAALITTLLWWIAGRMFLWYISTFHSYSVLYGAYAFLLVFIFWVYYSSIAFIAGVIIAQLYRERRMMKKPL